MRLTMSAADYCAPPPHCCQKFQAHSETYACLINGRHTPVAALATIIAGRAKQPILCNTRGVDILLRREDLPAAIVDHWKMRVFVTVA